MPMIYRTYVAKLQYTYNSNKKDSNRPMSQTFKIALHCWALIDMLPKNITNSPYVRMLISIPEKLKKQPYTGLNISTYDLSHFPCIQRKSIDQCKSFIREELTQTRFDLRMTIFRDG